MIKAMELQNSRGMLKVGVFSLSIAKPISYANVRIFNYNNDGTRNVILIMETSVDGITETVSLSAPPIEYSQAI